MLTFSCHAKTVSHITQVDLHSTSATQQLRGCTGFRIRITYMDLHSTSATQQLHDCTRFHIRITYIVSQKSIPLDV